MRSPDEKDALELINLIYEAGEDPTRWSSFLKRAAETLGGTLSSIVSHDPSTLNGRLTVVHGADPAVIQAYDTQYGAENIYVQRAAGRLLPGEVVHGGMLCTDDEVLRSTYYEGLLRPNDWFYLAGGVVTAGPELVSLFSVFRSRRLGQYDEAELAFLRILMPHLQRVVRLHQQLDVLRAGVTAIDSITTGVVSVTSGGKVLMANEYARSVFDEKDGLTLNREGTLTVAGGKGRMLSEAIRKVTQTSNGRGFAPGKALPVERISAKRPYQLLIMPTRSSRLTFSYEKPAALIFISDPEKHKEQPPAILQRIYGLTVAEARLTSLLANGESLQRSCEALGIQYTTGRAHLRSIFSKLNVCRQSELVSVVNRTVGST